jgi:hypothetical protein
MREVVKKLDFCKRLKNLKFLFIFEHKINQSLIQIDAKFVSLMNLGLNVIYVGFEFFC